MKKIILLLTGIMLSLLAFSQSPDAFTYQALLRDASGAIKANANVTVQMSILQGSATGSSVYTETFAITTNGFGLININVGKGTLVSGNFTSIDWTTGPYFIKITLDGTDFGTSQLLSVPYAKYADKAGNGFSGSYNDLTNKPTLATVATSGSYNDLTNRPTIPTNLNQLTPDAGNRTITNVATPVNNTDATNKTYVDAIIIQVMNSLAKSNETFTSLTTGTLKDGDGNTYNTIKIGSQWWIVENLKTTHYRNGDLMPKETNNTNWSNLTTGARCYYSNDSATYAGTYGALYNWYTMVDSHDLCPTGWHIPSDAEFATLQTYLGGSGVSGGKLKETGTTHWSSPNTGATNSSGFTALPAGYRDSGGQYFWLGNAAYWWSSTAYSTTNAIIFNVFYNYNLSQRYNDSKKLGFSVRCIKD